MQKPVRLLDNLTEFGQEHLLDFWHELSSDERTSLQKQIETIDFELLSSHFPNKELGNPWANIAARAESPPTANDAAIMTPAARRQTIEIGTQALSDGAVAVILVAGGQGTRLGFDLPKGMLPVGPISQRTLFQVLVDLLRARIRTHGSPIPLVIMTSPATHDATVQYFCDNDYLGLEKDQLEIVCQGTMPAVDRSTGRVLLAEKHQISLSPDGHGGMLQALATSGALARLNDRGIEHLFYGQIDNPLMQLGDPLTLGYHLLHRSEMTTQVVRKLDPMQRVGNVVLVDGRVQVIEYSDLPEAMARQRQPDGRLKFWAGNIAVHVFELNFLERARFQATALPFHLASKKVPFVDRRGNLVVPSEPNAIKFERFIFDLLPSAERAIVVEIDPADGFAPVKNGLDVATDNLHTAQAAMVAQHVRWLRQCGAIVTDRMPIEIHPLIALDAEQLRERIDSWRVFDRATYLQP